MTERRPEVDWDDDRLNAAFADRASATPATPAALIGDVLARIATVRPASRFWPSLAATAVIGALVIVIAGSTILSSITPDPSDPGASGAASSARGDPTPALPASALLDVVGDPITVSAALVVRESENGAREIAVEGFLSPVPVLACPAVALKSNPTLLRCPHSFQWVMEQPEKLFTVGPDSASGSPPTGPAFRPSFALVATPTFPTSDQSDGRDATPLPVVLVGHFNDRRASLCATSDRADCADTFIVDRVVSIAGVEQPGGTFRRRTDVSPKDLVEDVDGLAIGAAAGSIVIARQLLEISTVAQVEPVLADDAVIPNFGPPTTLFWLTTVVQEVDGVPTARTFGLIDGSNWFAEITAEMAVYLERTGPAPSPDGRPDLPSADPSVFDGAPASVLGIPVRDIAELQRDRKAAMDSLGRDEHAIRAWYIGPNPAVVCTDAVPPVHEPRPPCDEARHWLLDDPSQFGDEPGQSRLNPAEDHYTPVLNPLLPIDVAFDVGETWRDGNPVPRPVIVLGHFGDHRVDTYAGNLYFVIDALAWTPGRTVGSFDTVVHLTTAATEDVNMVLGRVVPVSQGDAVATWVTVVDPDDFVAMDRRAMREFSAGAPVWMVARLIPNEQDGRQRLAVVWSWTADGGNRVWREECPDCSPDLATTLDIHDLDANTPLVRVFDYDQAIVSVGPATGLGELDWHRPHGNAADYIDVARGRTARELVLRWRSPARCIGPWDVTVHRAEERFGDDDIYIRPSITGEGCEGERVTRRIVVEFEEPIDIDRIAGPSCCG